MLRSLLGPEILLSERMSSELLSSELLSLGLMAGDVEMLTEMGTFVEKNCPYCVSVWTSLCSCYFRAEIRQRRQRFWNG